MTHGPPGPGGWGDDELAFGPPRVRFGATEFLHLAGAVLILTLCFAYAQDRFAWPGHVLPNPVVLVGSALAVGTGFILHELAHKVVAQRYGHWAEFRAQFLNLLGSLALALLTGIVIAAPGAVLIRGRVTPRENGLISLVGPGANFLIALLVWPFTWVANVDAPVPQALRMVTFANALLCVFNLIPLGPLDGKKVLRWSALAFAGAAMAGVGLLLAVLFVPADQMPHLFG